MLPTSKDTLFKHSSYQPALQKPDNDPDYLISVSWKRETSKIRFVALEDRTWVSAHSNHLDKICGLIEPDTVQYSVIYIVLSQEL